ncbi:unnamed protein product, partial [Protopolystoma xenopodis]
NAVHRLSRHDTSGINRLASTFRTQDATSKVRAHTLVDVHEALHQQSRNLTHQLRYYPPPPAGYYLSLPTGVHRTGLYASGPASISTSPLSRASLGHISQVGDLVAGRFRFTLPARQSFWQATATELPATAASSLVSSDSSKTSSSMHVSRHLSTSSDVLRLSTSPPSSPIDELGYNVGDPCLSIYAGDDVTDMDASVTSGRSDFGLRQSASGTNTPTPIPISTSKFDSTRILDSNTLFTTDKNGTPTSLRSSPKTTADLFKPALSFYSVCTPQIPESSEVSLRSFCQSAAMGLDTISSPTTLSSSFPLASTAAYYSCLPSIPASTICSTSVQNPPSVSTLTRVHRIRLARNHSNVHDTAVSPEVHSSTTSASNSS